MGNGMMVPWTCRAGHVMGQVTINGSKRRKLIVYRFAVGGLDADGDDEIDVIAVVDELSALDVRCSICNQVRTWVPSSRGVRQLAQSLMEYGDGP